MLTKAKNKPTDKELESKFTELIVENSEHIKAVEIARKKGDRKALEKAISARNKSNLKLAKFVKDNKLNENPHFTQKYGANKGHFILKQFITLKFIKMAMQAIRKQRADKEQALQRQEKEDMQRQDKFKAFLEENITLCDEIIDFEKKAPILTADAKARILNKLGKDITRLDNAYKSSYAYFAKKCNVGLLDRPRTVIKKFVDKNRSQVYSLTR